eukprot:529075_1
MSEKLSCLSVGKMSEKISYLSVGKLSRPRKSLVGVGIITGKSCIRENLNQSSQISIASIHEKSFDAKNDLLFVKNLIFKSWINLLLLFVPVGIGAHFGKLSPPIVFFTNFLAMIPLANILGESTERLAERLGEIIGGLLNATFGNAVEIVVMVLALIKASKSDENTQETLLTVVQTSLIGSIFSNSLLVLGCAFVANGVYHKQSQFNVVAASENVSLLLIAAFVMILPGPYSEHIGGGTEDSLMVSRAAAIILLLLYICFLIFVLYSHTHILSPEDISSMDKEKKNQLLLDDFEYDQSSIEIANGSIEDELELSLIGSIILLLCSTVFVSILSEFLVDSINPMAEQLDITPAFIGIILLPVIGNAVEHITAVRMAAQNKMDVAISIAIGSATQVAMFVVPVAILIAWCLGLALDLAFNPFEINLFLYSTIIIFTIISDGASNWLEGAMLLGLYVLIGIAVFNQNYSN